MRDKRVFDQKAIGLLEKMFTLNPHYRVSISEILADPYFSDPNEPPCEKSELPKVQSHQELKPKMPI